MKYFKDLWPTMQQYRHWSMPSKLTFIGAYVGIFSLLLSIAILVITSLLETKVDKVLIQGEWDKKKANEIVLELMKQYGGPNEYGFEPYDESDKIMHKIFDHYTLNYVNETVKIVIAYSNIESNTGRCSAPKLSIVEFVKNQNGWNLKESYINAFPAGTWGKPPSSINIYAIGFNIFGVVVQHGETGKGYTNTYTSIHANIGGEFLQIFFEVTGGDSSGSFNPLLEDWNSAITFRQQGTSIYDLVIHQTGRKDGQPLNFKAVYKFDGRKYSTSNIYQ
nr:hypothetical protein [uncultured Desulfobacter sp.]